MTAEATTLRRYHAAVDRSGRLGNGDASDSALTTFQQRAVYRLDRLREMLAALGSPLDLTPVVHVAGTSGKGSTATAIASILTTAGYRTGLHTSPYLQVATEKLQIDRELIAGDVFATLIDETLDRLTDAGFTPSYGQLWMAMTLSWFAQETVDVAVIEAGAGGRFDLSNVVQPQVSVITEIGFDHMDTLGSTIEEIAWHKAGIIEPFVPVVAAVSNPAAMRVIARTANELGADLHPILPVAGDFQQTNETTARRAVELLDFDISADDFEDGLTHARIPGRLETMQHDPLVVLDGAHNPQKVTALSAWWQRIHPGTKPVIVAGFLESKDHETMLSALAPMASALILTEPFVEGKRSAATGLLVSTVAQLGFSGPTHQEPDPRAALEVAIELAHRIQQPVLVTGSLYLIGNVRGRWYPGDAVLLQRTSWPLVHR